MKLIELVEGYWKNVDIERQEASLKKKPTAPTPNKKYVVLINGRPWKKNGETVVFFNRPAAEKSANTIRDRYSKATQVVPV